MPIEIESPVSRLTSSIPERLPGWLARVGSAVSLNSLIALSNSVFLSLDRTMPVCISHLHGEQMTTKWAGAIATPETREAGLRGQSAPAQERRVKAREVG